MLQEPKLIPDFLAFFEDLGLERPEPGVFICQGLNFQLTLERDQFDCDEPVDFGSYGVCDSLEQLKQTEQWQTYTASPRPVVLVMTPFRRRDVPGVRLYKWGPYVGNQALQGYEDFANEPEVELVYVFDFVTLKNDVPI
jgi:hypothetical protein